MVGKENKMLRGITKEPENDVEPSNRKRKGSRNTRRVGDMGKERKNVKNVIPPIPKCIPIDGGAKLVTGVGPFRPEPPESHHQDRH